MPEKLLSDKQVAKLTKVQRINKHIDENYFLSDADMQYFKKLRHVFSLCFGEENKSRSVRAMMLFYNFSSRQQALNLINDCIECFGDFMEVNKSAQRWINHQRYEALYAKAIEDEETDRAIYILGQMDKLHGLYQWDAPISTKRRLPTIVRTSDPKALKNG